MQTMSSDLFSVRGRVIILTGGLGFLGRKYAASLTEAGAKVIVWDIGILESYNDVRCDLFQRVDITDEDSVKAAVAEILEIHGHIDVLINNAAMNPAVGKDDTSKLFSPLEEYPLELWRKELEVNLTGMFICTKAVVPSMKKQGRGIIVNVASEASVIAHDHRVYNTPGKYKSPAYIASKTGVVGFTRACAAQLGQFGIRVNAFSPGGVRNDSMPDDFVNRFGATNMFGRMAESDEYSGIIVFLCSDASSFLTGANLNVDGGKTAW